MRLKKSKTWDMRWNWLREKEQQKIFKISWEPGKKNMADLFTKHHEGSYHLKKRSDYILKGFHIGEIMKDVRKRLRVRNSDI